jgi:tetratricopeptide (TPR) repeat protein
VDRVLRVEPNYAHAFLVRGLVLLMGNDHLGAIRDLHRSLELGGFNSHAHGALTHAYAASGQHETARALLGEMHARAQQEHVPPFAFAAAHTGLGEPDEAFAWLERGIAERDEMLAENFFDPMFDALRDDPRCARVLDRLGATPRSAS